MPTSKTKKDRKELARKLHAGIQSACDQFNSIWVFEVQNMRNQLIKDIRSKLLDSRIFMGKTKLMLHALGSSQETAHLPGTDQLAPYLSGEVGLLFTSRPATEIENFFTAYAEMDYARAGATAPEDFVIQRGELRTHYGVEGGQDDPVPMAIEPMLRKLGVPTKLVKGKVVLEEVEDENEEGYVVCRRGDTLDSRQTTLLKIFGVRMAEFKVNLKAVWEKSNGSAREVGAMAVD